MFLDIDLTEDEVEMLRNFLHQLNGKRDDALSLEAFVRLLRHGAPNRAGGAGGANVSLAKKVSLGGGDGTLAQASGAKIQSALSSKGSKFMGAIEGFQSGLEVRDKKIN